MNRQKLILFLLLILFGGAVVYAVARSPKQQQVAKLTYGPGAVASAPRPKTGAAAKEKGAVPATGAPAATAIPEPPAPPAGGGRTGAAATTPAPPPTGTATAAKPASTGTAAVHLPGAGPLIANDESRVHLELLDQGGRFSGYRRNIFAPIFREEVKAPPIRLLPPLPPRPSRSLKFPPPPKPGAATAVPPPPPPPPPTPEQLADQELAKFTFLGFLKKNGNKTVFLSKNNEIFLAKKGSKLGANFTVSELTDDAITIKSIAEGRELVIPLVENRGLSARRTR